MDFTLIDGCLHFRYGFYTQILQYVLLNFVKEPIAFNVLIKLTMFRCFNILTYGIILRFQIQIYSASVTMVTFCVREYMKVASHWDTIITFTFYIFYSLKRNYFRIETVKI